MTALPGSHMFGAAMAVVLVTAPAETHAQLVAEVRIGAGIGQYEANYSSLDLAPGLAGRVSLAHVGYPIRGLFTAAPVAGLERSAFRCSSGLCQDATVHHSSSGPFLGARLSLDRTNLRPWLQTDVGAYALKASWTAGPGGRAVSGRSVGLTIGSGVDFRWNRIIIAPGLRFTGYRTSFDDASEPARVFVAALDVGVRIER